MPVNYRGYSVEDLETRNMLEKIALTLGHEVKVSSGDRDFVPRGGARTSLHLAHRAVDFHVVGMRDSQVFEALRLHRKAIFGNKMQFQVILHGRHTQTQGAHLHLGNAAEKPFQQGFMREGIQSGSAGIYRRSA